MSFFFCQLNLMELEQVKSSNLDLKHPLSFQRSLVLFFGSGQYIWQQQTKNCLRKNYQYRTTALLTTTKKKTSLLSLLMLTEWNTKPHFYQQSNFSYLLLFKQLYQKTIKNQNKEPFFVVVVVLYVINTIFEYCTRYTYWISNVLVWRRNKGVVFIKTKQKKRNAKRKQI